MKAKAQRIGTSVALFAAAVVMGGLVITWIVLRSAVSPASSAPAHAITNEVVWLPDTMKRVLIPPRRDPEKENIERAESLNLYQIQRYERSGIPPVLESLQREQSRRSR